MEHKERHFQMLDQNLEWPTIKQVDNRPSTCNPNMTDQHKTQFFMYSGG